MFCSEPLENFVGHPEAESKEKHGVWDLMPELTITSSYVHPSFDSSTFSMGGQPYARVDLNPMLCFCRLYPPVRDFGFGLSSSETKHRKLRSASSYHEFLKIFLTICFSQTSNYHYFVSVQVKVTCDHLLLVF
jgi:hypothetical protein